jgi:hypothetical protein
VPCELCHSLLCCCCPAQPLTCSLIVPPAGAHTRAANRPKIGSSSEDYVALSDISEYHARGAASASASASTAQRRSTVSTVCARTSPNSRACAQRLLSMHTRSSHKVVANFTIPLPLTRNEDLSVNNTIHNTHGINLAGSGGGPFACCGERSKRSPVRAWAEAFLVCVASPKRQPCGHGRFGVAPLLLDRTV